MYSPFCRGDIRQWSWVWEKEIEKVLIVFNFIIEYFLNLTIKGSLQKNKRSNLGLSPKPAPLPPRPIGTFRTFLVTFGQKKSDFQGQNNGHKNFT